MNMNSFNTWKAIQEVEDIDTNLIALAEVEHRKNCGLVLWQKNTQRTIERFIEKDVTKLDKPIIVRELENKTYSLVLGLKGFILSRELEHKIIPCIIVKDVSRLDFVSRINDMPADTQKVEKFSNINIPYEFASISPKYRKIKERWNYYNQVGKLDKAITVDKDNVLVDGYTRYMLAEMLGLESVPVKYA